MTKSKKKKIAVVAVVVAVVAAALAAVGVVGGRAWLKDYTPEIAREKDNVSWQITSDGVLEADAREDVPSAGDALLPCFYEEYLNQLAVRDEDDMSRRLWRMHENISRGFTVTKVVIGEGIDGMTEQAFLGCPRVEEVVVREGNASLTAADGVLFTKDMTELLYYPPARPGETYTVPDGVTRIAPCAFTNCAALKEIVLPDSLSVLGADAFYFCSTLERVSLPAALTEIGALEGQGLFGFCDGLKEIDVAPENPVYAGEDGVLFNKEKTVLLRYPAAAPRESYTVPAGVTEIAVQAFVENGLLADLTLSEGVTIIGEGAFGGCAALRSVFLPQSLERIDRMAFYGCTSLAAVTVPGGVTTVDYSAFSGCLSLRELTLEEGVRYVRSDAFYNCPALKTVTLPASLTKIEDRAIGYRSASFFHYGYDAAVWGLKIHCPAGSVAAYYAEENGIKTEYVVS